MRQFLLPPDWEGGPSCDIEGGPARYLLRVLRLAPGDEFPGLDQEGRRRICRVLEIGEGRISLAVSPPLAPSPNETPLPDTHGSRGKTARPSPPMDAGKRLPGADGASEADEEPEATGATSLRLPRIVLVQAIAKANAMDLVFRQAAEAGVSRVIPLATRRSVARQVEGREGVKLERWERIVREGLQQSGSRVATRVEEAVDLAGLAARLGPSGEKRLCLFLHEAPLAKTSLHEYLGSAPEEIVICVGPEGGFAPDEVDALSAAGFRPLLLPGAILRTETAALFAVASVEIILAERSSWIPSH